MPQVARMQQRLYLYLLTPCRLCCMRQHVQRGTTMHPYITSELVRQHRASLAADADQRRLAVRVLRERDADGPARRLAVAARLVMRRIRTA